ncbi:polysaccharide biosynthesis C-terminal domain-containing protein [Chishuiella sp.]|uniref:MATE family efflux transporter n=1 Tax=Chishuiella sp. TaxID=1969467 RepID=UPI00391BD169
MLLKIKNIIRDKTLLKIFITLFLRGIGVISLFGITILMTRNFSPKIVGDYDFSRTLLLLLGSIALLGTDQSILYFSGILESQKSFHNIKHLYKKIIIYIFYICLIINIIFIFIPKSILELDTYYFLKNGILILFFYSLTIFNTEYLRAINFIYLSELFRNTFKYIPLLIGCLLLINYNLKYTLVDFFYFGFIILAIITTILCFIFNNKIHNNEGNYFIKSNFLLKKSTPILFSNVLIFINLSIDVFLLKKYYSSVDVAYYSTVMKLVTILSMVIISFNINITTKVSELFNLNKLKELQILILKNTRFVFLINLSISIILILFGTSILDFFGKGYSTAYFSLIILLFSQLLSSFLCSAPIILNMIGKSNIYFIILLISVLICLLMNIILIPLYGINGASVSFLVTNFFSYFSIYIYIKKKFNLSISFF